MKNRIIVAICIVIAIALSNSASAMMAGLAIDDLVNDSVVVVRGNVEDSYSFWSEDGTIILTKAYVRVEEVIRERRQGAKIDFQKIAVEYVGGEVGDIGMVRSNVSPLEVGEDVVIFLKVAEKKQKAAGNIPHGKNNSKMATDGDEQIYNMTGDAQGKYLITKQGMAIRKDIPIVNNKENIVNNIPVEELIETIRRVK